MRFFLTLFPKYSPTVAVNNFYYYFFYKNFLIAATTHPQGRFPAGEKHGRFGTLPTATTVQRRARRSRTTASVANPNGGLIQRDGLPSGAAVTAGKKKNTSQHSLCWRPDSRRAEGASGRSPPLAGRPAEKGRGDGGHIAPALKEVLGQGLPI